MTEVEQLRTENRELKRRLRDAELMVDAHKRALAKAQSFAQGAVNASATVDREVSKYHRETWLRSAGVSNWPAIDAISEFICKCDPNEAICTLEDLQFRTRDEIAAIRGVGQKTMMELDRALAEHGLTWEASGLADEAPIPLAAAA